jgi:Flp pilus assembly pilin Flp
MPGQGFLSACERLKRLWSDDRGEHAMEFLMILTFGVLPIIAAVFLLEDVFQEYVAFGQIFVTSPFF